MFIEKDLKVNLKGLGDFWLCHNTHDIQSPGTSGFLFMPSVGLNVLLRRFALMFMVFTKAIPLACWGTFKFQAPKSLVASLRQQALSLKLCAPLSLCHPTSWGSTWMRHEAEKNHSIHFAAENAEFKESLKMDGLRVAEMLKVKDVDEYLCNVLSSCYMIAHDLAHGQ